MTELQKSQQEKICPTQENKATPSLTNLNALSAPQQEKLIEYPMIGLAQDQLFTTRDIMSSPSSETRWNFSACFYSGKIALDGETFLGKMFSFEELVNAAITHKQENIRQMIVTNIFRYGGPVAARALQDIIDRTQACASDALARASDKKVVLSSLTSLLAMALFRPNGDSFPNHTLSTLDTRRILRGLGERAKDPSHPYSETIKTALSFRKRTSNEGNEFMVPSEACFVAIDKAFPGFADLASLVKKLQLKAVGDLNAVKTLMQYANGEIDDYQEKWINPIFSFSLYGDNQNDKGFYIRLSFMTQDSSYTLNKNIALAIVKKTLIAGKLVSNPLVNDFFQRVDQANNAIANFYYNNWKNS